MNPAIVYTALNLLDVFAWLALFVRPRLPLVLRCAGGIVPVVFTLAYALLVVLRAGRGEGDFLSLAGVAARNIPQWRVVPCLVLTCLVGPMGWLMYLGVRFLSTPTPRPPSPES